jgi:phenylpyruvate tautomerase PptA (4-oxalocrotonate tautomerase family)
MRAGEREGRIGSRRRTPDTPVITTTGPIVEVETKRESARGATEVASSAYGLPAEKIVVIICENAPENIAVGGVLKVDWE